MKKLVKELWDYAGSSEQTEYVQHHRRVAHQPNFAKLKNFLFATMDEVRLRHADDYATLVLEIVDMEDADHFRRGVLRREMAADISYTRQRDHAAHTLYNYLMGWYIYSHCPDVKQNFQKYYEKRLSLGRLSPEDKVKEVREGFGFLWPFVSLLHDVGYLFEGSLEILNTDVQNEKVKRGVSVVQDYFHHRFWVQAYMDSVAKRERLRRLSGVSEPDFSLTSIAAVGDTLRELGDLEILRQEAHHELDNHDHPVPEILRTPGGLSIDAFDVWQRHYLAYEQTTMAQRIEDAQKAFQTLLWEGIPGSGVRILDHGICSGLLLLLYSTFFHRIYFGLGPTPPIDQQDRAVWQAFRHSIIPSGISYEAHWWWVGVVWGTAAAAIHNLQQSESPWPGCNRRWDPLKIEEDPLTYLGVLVDVLEEWDRYTVSRESVFCGKLPLQGADVLLGVENGVVQIDYRDSVRASAVTNLLNTCLNRWDKIVKIHG